MRCMPRAAQAMHNELLATASSVGSQRSAVSSTLAPAGSLEAGKADGCDWPAARRDREDSALASGDRPGAADGGAAGAPADEEEGPQARLVWLGALQGSQCWRRASLRTSVAVPPRCGHQSIEGLCCQ